MTPKSVTVVGGGLAGSEAAWQLARRGIAVVLHEMRPVRPTPVHRTGGLAELVCSNSLKAVELSTPHGLLKAEMERLGSLIVACAQRTRVPAGGALAVVREAFPEAVTQALEAEPNVTLVRDEVTAIPEGIVVLAVGPMVSEALRADIARFTGGDYLYFFDAIAPVIEADSIDRDLVFSASRYDKGGGSDYLNCPLDQAQYDAFVSALLAGEKAPLHEVDRTPFFEGCLPIEEMARCGRDTLSFGPMKPVGLIDPRTGERPFAVVQLRQDNLAAEHYSMVGFQTQLRWPEQTRIFRTIPRPRRRRVRASGTDPPQLLHQRAHRPSETLQTRQRPSLFFAGQISGVEGYTESAASGLLAGMNAARLACGQPPLVLPADTMLGALCRYVAHAPAENYQPTNAAFGLLAPVAGERGKKRDRRAFRAASALASLDAWLAASSGEEVAALR